MANFVQIYKSTESKVVMSSKYTT